MKEQIPATAMGISAVVLIAGTEPVLQKKNWILFFNCQQCSGYARGLLLVQSALAQLTGKTLLWQLMQKNSKQENRCCAGNTWTASGNKLFTEKDYISFHGQQW